MKFLGAPTIASLAILSISCGGTPNVRVQDSSGNPLANASVTPMARSFKNTPIKTNQKGEADIMIDFPPIHWLTVSKNGYQSEHVSFEQPKPIIVTLKAN